MTEKKSTLLDQAYTSFIDLMLSSDGQVDHLGRVATNDVMGYGTTMDEKIHDLKGLKDLANIQREQSADMKFQYEIIPVFRKTMNQENTAIIVDEIQITMQIKGEEIELQMRLSTVLDYIEGKWKVVHWHGSKPEYDSGGSDTWHKEEWKQKNEALQKLVDKKTVDLENKNRDLKIESSLERIRAIAMSMQKAEGLLDVVEILFVELKTLGFVDLRNTIINIFNDTKEIFLNYDYSDYGVGGISEVDYNSHPSNRELVDKMRKSSTDFMISEFTGDELDEWRKWRSKQGQMPDAKLDQAKSIYYYEYSIGVGTIGISTFSPINADQLKILNKIRNVFELAYRRYADIEQAEAHAREANIEAALERVRSIAMGMQKPHDLLDVCQIISKQLELLNISDIRNIQVAIIDESKKKYLNYQYFTAYSKMVFEETEYENNPTANAMVSEMQRSANSFFSGSMKRKELKDFQRWRKKYNQFPDPLLDKCPSVHYYFYSIGEGGLGLTMYKDISSESLEIFKRFHKVFKLAYQRFIDIEKAEAQAREAEIELSLERVRARAMAMQSSDELREAVQVIYEQLQHLNFESKACNIIIIDDDTGNSQYWVSGFTQDIYPVSYPVPYFDHSYYEALLQPWRQGKQYVVYKYEGKNKQKFDKIFFTKTGFKNIPEEAKNAMISIPSVTLSTAFFSHGALQVLGPEAISEEKITILQRFASVFDQTYTRFLDLKKAEEQAREAQIETALERVRSRSLAMHKSEELAELSLELVKQVQALGVETWFCAFNIYDDDSKGSLEWGSNGQGTFPKYRTPREGIFLSYYEAGQKGETLLINEIDENECPTHYDYLCSLPGVGEQLLKMRDEGIPFPTSQIDHVAYFKYGYILFITFEPAPEAHDIFKRFANVFEQTYTRFLDLQKAEAQAREAQIEAALERVRSRSMAMHKSEELSETAMVMFEQLRSLGQISDRLGIVVYNEQQQFFENWITDQSGKQLTKAFISSFEEPTTFAKIYKGLKEKKDSIVIDLAGEELKSWIQFIKGNMKMFINESNIKNRRVHYAAFFSHGSLLCTFHEPVADNFIQLLVRFAKVFDQTYTRFLDLQKAEAQARESQIELALERVRARAMSMQKSEELSDLVNTVFTELTKLDFALSWCIINIIDEPNRSNVVWGANTDAGKPPESYFMKFENHRFHHEMMKAYQERKEKWVFILEGDEKLNYDDYLFTDTEFRRVSKTIQKEMRNTKRYVASFTFNDFGGLQTIGEEPLSLENLNILSRFGKVFDLTYTRFNDLQKAEDQAREAQIELSLERIRAQVTAMQESSELLDIVVTMRREFVSLGHEAHYFWYMRYLPETYEKAMTSGDGTKIGMVMTLPRHIHGDIKLIADWEKSKKPTVVFAMDVETAVDYVHKMITLGDFKQVDPNAPTLDDIRHIGGLTFVMARTTHGEIGFSLPGTVPEPPQESLATLARFASVFDLAYRRFEDLKSAEQQNRETEIELALERVRAKTMAMHNSEDMGNTVLTLFHEVLKLGLDDDIRCGIGILEGSKRMETRSATLDSNGEVDLRMGMLDMTIHPMLKRIKKAWKSGGSHYIDQMSGQDVIRYYTALNNEPDYPFFVDLDSLPETQFHNSFSFSEGILFAFSPNLMSEEATKILDRFARVFGQTYRRFRDLQKAEEQTREAKIEASLERIRSQAMAMQHSDDLVKSTAILFEEFEKLELSVDRCGIGIIEKETRDCQLYTTVTTHDGKTELATGITSLTIHPMLIETFEAWESQQSLQYILEGKELEDYYALVSKSEFHLPSEAIENSASLPKEYYLYTPFGAGGLYVFSATEPAKEEKNIIRRFAEVFHLTYTRYEDLQKAEARALEAVKQASLDRVRGDIASMRTTEDLQRITPLIWSELEILKVPFIRCGVFIIDESSSNVQVYLTTPDGKPIGVLNLPIDANELTRNTVEHWRNNKVYTIHWNKDDFVNWMQSMISLGQVQTAEQYQGYSKPPESLDLHFIPFKQGMLYVGNTELLLPEKIELVNTLAKAFSVAYSRYEDFVNLEDAKTRVEKTLSELKSAQSQLIHSEKMASLGELTAGIAHEIQNPLNFVNNFSEVSVDLIEEMDEEMAAGNNEEVNAIADDLKQNLEKITAHGKRASFIVKGMLEHSRTNAGEKTPTDINELADEFLRLSYHGLRAKDKSFNAEFKTEFDDELPKIKVISQDLGRVLLNLINNAFYAVSARVSATDDIDYKPTVTLSTKKMKDKVEISVKDNGNGISEDIKDKIFQPFFTTKPTGEGTGLGLSMSYDIITKGHDGKLEVKTKEGEGTTFLISIPIKN